MADKKNLSNQKNRNQSGSLTNSEPEFLEVGKIGRTHGIRGEVWMDLYTDFPEMLQSGKVLYLGKTCQPKTIRTFHISGSRGLICLSGVDTPEQAGSFTNQLVYVKAEHLPQLPDGKYYQHEMIGIGVIDENRQPIGKVVDILQTGSNDVYVVVNESDESKEILVPAIKSVIINIDIQNKMMMVRLQEWI